MASENETTALRAEKDRLKQDIDQLNSALNELGRENQALQVSFLEGSVFELRRRLIISHALFFGFSL